MALWCEAHGLYSERLKHLAIAVWLTADLAHWARAARSVAAEPRALAIQNLEHWKVDPDLAGIRGEAAIKALPADEREAWNRLWHEVDEVLDRARLQQNDRK
jgi:hypothetical protein